MNSGTQPWTQCVKTPSTGAVDQHGIDDAADFHQLLSLAAVAGEARDLPRGDGAAQQLREQSARLLPNIFRWCRPVLELQGRLKQPQLRWASSTDPGYSAARVNQTSRPRHE
jgi:hypothetical protein